MMLDEMEMFRGLPARFDCTNESNPNRAFEKLVTRLVMESVATSGFQAIGQAPKKIWFGDNGDVRGITTDILVKSGKDVVAILDAKCKEQLTAGDFAELFLYINEYKLKSCIAILPTYPGRKDMKWISSDGKTSIHEKRLDVAKTVSLLRTNDTESIAKTIRGWIDA